MGLIPISIDEAIAKTEQRRLQFQRITQKDLLFFSEELVTLVKAGRPLDRSLSITAELVPAQLDWF